MLNTAPNFKPELDSNSYSAENLDKLLDNLLQLISDYNQVHRPTTNPFLLQKVQENFPEWTYDPQNTLIRETLAEHVGSLSIIAAFLFTHLKHKVDLGRVLSMLAIHDIAETISGDVNTFLKQQSDRDLEYKNTLFLLGPDLLKIFEEFEKLQTPEAKFAKSVDKLAPDLMDILCPAEISIFRFKVQVNKTKEEMICLIKEKKSPYMQWDPFLAKFHERIMVRLEDKLLN